MHKWNPSNISQHRKRIQRRAKQSNNQRTSSNNLANSSVHTNCRMCASTAETFSSRSSTNIQTTVYSSKTPTPRARSTSRPGGHRTPHQAQFPVYPWAVSTKEYVFNFSYPVMYRKTNINSGKYLLVRPYPSLRILFTSPSLRIPGMLQSSFLNRIGETGAKRDSIVNAMMAGRSVTARIKWMTRFNNQGRHRWIHCTPLLANNGQIGVWMVIVIDDEHEHSARWQG